MQILLLSSTCWQINEGGAATDVTTDTFIAAAKGRISTSVANPADIALHSRISIDETKAISIDVLGY